MKDFIFMSIFITLAVVVISFLSCSDDSKGKEHSNEIETTRFGEALTNNKSIDSTLFHKGEIIFRADCNACHVAKNRIHNYLEGVVDRVGEEYLKLYLTKQDSLIAAKDSNALMVKRVWNNQGNSHNFIYSKEELNAIIEYLE